MVRKILAVIVGLFVGGVCMSMLQLVSHAIYPPPAGLDLNDPEVFQQDAFRDFVASLPIEAFAIVLASHAIGALVAAFVCTAIVGNKWRVGTLIVSLMLMMGGVMNLVLIPHPAWFGVADLVVYLPAAFLGEQVAIMRQRSKAESVAELSDDSGSREHPA